MNEQHPNHHTQFAESRRQFAADLVRRMHASPVDAEAQVHALLEQERRRIWNRAIKTLEWYVGDEPSAPVSEQLEHPDDYAARLANYQCMCSAYGSKKAYVEILKERRDLEEPPQHMEMI